MNNLFDQLSGQTDADRAAWSKAQSESAHIPTVGERLADSSNYGTIARFGVAMVGGYFATGLVTKSVPLKLLGAAAAGAVVFGVGMSGFTK